MFDSILFEDFADIIWLGQTLTLAGSLPWLLCMMLPWLPRQMLYIYPFRFVDPIILTYKFT